MPIEFRCPHCGTQTSFPDSSAGPTGSCVGCGKPLTVPAPGGSEAYATPAERWKLPNDRVVMMTGLGVFVMLVCGGLLLPLVISSRVNGRKFHCANCLQQISMAMLIYEADHGSFPPAYVADKNGRPMHSWRVLILPYLGRRDLYEQYHFDEPWDGPHNRTLAHRMPWFYRCPSDTRNADSMTDYAVVVGPNTAFPGAKAVKLSDIPDGLQNTLLVVEAAKAGIPWLEPRDLSEDRMQFKINGDPNTEISSYHSQGANAAFCDGHTEFLSDSENARVLKDMVERNDGHPRN